MREVINALKARVQGYPVLYEALRTVKWRLVQSPVEVAKQETVRRIQALEKQVQAREGNGTQVGSKPILFFIASQHIDFFGLGAAFGLLSSLALRLTGQRVVYFDCKRGLSQCVLGTNREGVVENPPCDACISFRNLIYPSRHTVEFKAEPQKLQSLRSELNVLTWPELLNYSRAGLDLGKICLPSLRWVERRSNLEPNEFRRHMLIEYIISAANLAEHFAKILDRLQPRAVVLFNGIHYPEATAMRIAGARGIRVVTYEVGFGSASAFFSHGLPTKYAIRVPVEFKMGFAEVKKLDSYLLERFQGEFTRAGLRWSKLKALPGELLQNIKGFRQVVVIFTNVAWDTSEAYSNSYFHSMFEWLDYTLHDAEAHPDTIFIVRAHPHDLRPWKPTKEPVSDWLRLKGYLKLPNLIFISADSGISSYELISISKFCVVYNSTVGLEAAMMGKFTLFGGLPLHSYEGASYVVTSREDYCEKLQELLCADQPAVVLPEWQFNARRFFYFSLFKASLDFLPYIEPVDPPHFALKAFDIDALKPENSAEMRVIVDGILNGSEFYNP